MTMTYEKIFSEVKKNFKKAKKDAFTEDFAFQFNITGEGEGIFYAAYKDGSLSVEPYDYKDRDVIFEADGKTLIAIASGKLEPIDAIKSGKLSVDGNHELAKQILFLTSGSDEKKTEEKPAAKTNSKPVEKSEPKSAAKPTTKPTQKHDEKPAGKKETKTASKPAKK